MSNLRKQHPYEFFTRGNQIRANVESVKRKRWDYVPEHTEFRLPGAVQDWVDMEFEEEVSKVFISKRIWFGSLARRLTGYIPRGRTPLRAPYGFIDSLIID